MDPELTHALRQRFDVDAWHSRRAPGERTFVSNLAIEAIASPAFMPERVRRIEPPPAPAQVGRNAAAAAAMTETALATSEPAAAAETTPAAPATAAPESGPAAVTPARFLSASQAFLRNPSAPGALTRVDTFECASLADAHDLIVWLLGEFESPLIARKHAIVGDIAFGGADDASLLFARGNVVHLCRNVSRAIVSVLPLAAELDALTTGTRDAALVKPVELMLPSIRRRGKAAASRRSGRATRAEGERAGEAEAAREGEEDVEVTLGEAPRTRQPGTAGRWFHAAAGEVLVKGDRIVYRGPADGLGRLEVYERVGRTITP